MKSHMTKAEQAKIEQRRATVAANILAGMTYRDMASALNVSIGTIANDAKVIFNRWHKEQVRSVGRQRQLDARRYDIVINTLFEKVRGGDNAAIDRFLNTLKQRAALLGLNVREKLDITTGGKPLNDVVAQIVALAEKAGDKPLTLLIAYLEELKLAYGDRVPVDATPDTDEEDEDA